MNTIEQQLWDYIDGNLDAIQAKAIEEELATNAEIKLLYEDLLHINTAFSKLDVDAPSMSFTRNVMESIALVPAPIALKTKVNTGIIYGIAAFFVLSLVTLLIYALANSKISFADINSDKSFNFNYDQYINPTIVYSFLFADLVIGLVFLDYFLRKRIIPK